MLKCGDASPHFNMDTEVVLQHIPIKGSGATNVMASPSALSRMVRLLALGKPTGVVAVVAVETNSGSTDRASLKS